MKNKIIDAFLYLFVFMVIQFVVNYAVIFGWLLAEGKNLNEIGKGFADGTLQITAPMLIVSSAIYSIITLIIFLWKKWSEVSGNYLRTRPGGVLLWAAVAALGTVIPSEVFLELVSLPDVNSDILGEVMGSRWGFLSICSLAPLVEELVFRGAILRALLQGMNSHWVAIVVSALLFALVHMNPAQMPAAFILGIVLGFAYWWTDSLIAPVCIHVFNNSFACALGMISPDDNFIQFLGGTQGAVITAVVCVFWLYLMVYLIRREMRKSTEIG